MQEKCLNPKTIIEMFKKKNSLTSNKLYKMFQELQKVSHLCVITLVMFVFKP